MVTLQSISGITLDVIIVNLKILMLISATMVLAKTILKSSAIIRHALWLVTFFIILLLPFLSALTPQWYLPLLEMKVTKIEHDSTIVPIEPVQTDTKVVATGSKTVGKVIPVQPSSHSVRINWRSFFTLSYFWIGLWAIGFFVFNFRNIIGQYRLHKLIKTARITTDDLTSSYREEIKRRYNISSYIRILKSKSVATPLVTGIFRHRIILPDDYTNWSKENLKLVLLHEAAHIKRRDVITHFVVQLITTFYWFNPLVWLAQRQFILEREHACDDLVVAHATKPSAYADMLLDFAKSSISTPHTAYVGLSMARSTQIEGRLLAILNSKLNRTQSSRFSILKVGLLLLFVLGPILSFSPIAIRAEEQDTDTTHTALVIESLKYALKDEDADVRERAIRTLGKINTKAANELLYTSLQESHDWEIEINAARILLERGETKALQKFVDGLGQENEKTRIRSAKILKELRHPDALQPLVKALSDSNHEVQKQALKAICEIRSTKCIKTLADQMQHENHEFRAIAAWGLGEIEDAATLSYLYAALKDPNAKVRNNAIESIGDLKLAKSAPYIQPLQTDDEWYVRREAVRVLAEIQSRESVPYIIDSLHDKHWKVRASAASALGELGDRRALVPLSAALHDKSDNVRQEAADALGKFYKEK